MSVAHVNRLSTFSIDYTFFAERVVNVWIRPGFWVRGLVKITDLSAILNYYIPLPCFYALYFVLFI